MTERPNEAVEAAAKALYKQKAFIVTWEDVDGEILDLYRRKAGRAVEAAAPHIERAFVDRLKQKPWLVRELLYALENVGGWDADYDGAGDDYDRLLTDTLCTELKEWIAK